MNMDDYIEKMMHLQCEVTMQSGRTHQGYITKVDHFAGKTDAIVTIKLDNDPELDTVDVRLSRIESIGYAV